MTICAHKANSFSSIVTEGARTKLLFNCVLKKWEERVEPAGYQDVLVFSALEDMKMVCVLTPYQNMLIFSGLGDIKCLDSCTDNPDCSQSYSMRRIYF